MTAVVIALTLLAPARLYYQPDQPVPIHIAEDAAKLNVQEIGLALLDADGNVQASASIEPGQKTFDLAAKLPQIWDGKLHYVQTLDGDGKAVGSALVVVPLWPPDPRMRGQFDKPFGLRIYVEQLAVLHTSEGDITARFSPEAAPNTVRSFMHLVEGGLYTNVTVHRIVPDFVIQGGDPTGTGMGGPGYWIDLESSAKPHDAGTLSMARSSANDTAGSQFFICLSRQGCRSLDGKYAAFGDVIKGMNVVRKIAATPLADKRSGKPVKAPRIISAKLVPAPPRKMVEPEASADAPATAD